jgi:pyruvate-formate lyase-activating enzyme
MRVLITSPPWKGIVPYYTCRKSNILPVDRVQRKEHLLQLGINSEYQLGTEWPNGGLEIIKANIPSVDILDYPDMEEYESHLDSGKYDVVGFSFRRKDIPEIKKMVDMARGYGIKETWAGNYGANSPGLEGVFDRVFSGEGVAPLKEIIQGESLQPGTLRHPLLTGKIWNRFPIGFLYTSIGCRFKCKFCSTKNFIADPLYFSIEEIRRVLDYYSRGGVRTITILDETFLQDEKRSKQVIYELHKRDFTWHCTTRINLLKGRVRDLYGMGMRSIYTGVESIADNTLNEYSKGHSLSHVLDVFKELHDNGVRTSISYILGYESDTVASILESIRIIKHDIKPFCTVFLVLTPHSNSGLVNLEPLVVDNRHKHWDTRHLVWKHPNLLPEDIRELLWIAQKETLYPKNIINRRIIEKLKEMETLDSPFYSKRVHDIYSGNIN